MGTIGKSKLNIGIYFSYDLSAGGGYNQALNAIKQINKLAQDCYDVKIYTTQSQNVSTLREIGFSAQKIDLKLSDKWIQFSAINKVARVLQKKIGVIGSFERLLKKDNINLVYFIEPGPEALMLQEINHITTVWDNCHRDYPEFPEVRRNYEFFNREEIINFTLAKSIFVICDSDDLVKKINLRYGIDFARLISLPFSPSPFLKVNLENEYASVIKKYNLCSKYFFYPAQFWGHKNHIRIVKAFKLIESSLREKNITVVFCGGDKGSLECVKNAIKINQVEESFKILGFIPASDMLALYKCATALVMPTYFGPTNLPPLEAWLCGTPVIYSEMFQSQAGDAAIMIDPDSEESLAAAMLKILDPSYAKVMAERGFSRIKQIEMDRKNAEKTFLKKLRQFESHLECWSLD